MKYKVLRYFCGGKYPVGSIIEASNIAGLVNIDQAIAEGSIEEYIEAKSISSPENKAIGNAPENKSFKIEVNP